MHFVKSLIFLPFSNENKNDMRLGNSKAYVYCLLSRCVHTYNCNLKANYLQAFRNVLCIALNYCNKNNKHCVTK